MNSEPAVSRENNTFPLRSSAGSGHAATAPTTSSDQQFGFRPTSTVQQVPPFHHLPSNLPAYTSSSMPFPGHMSSWDQSMGNSPYYAPPSFSHVSPPPLLEANESFGLSEMEVPYTGGFAWPFEMAGGLADGRQDESNSAQPQSGSHGLTAQDIAAFMRINPGDEPFL